MNKEQAKELFRKDRNAYGSPKAVMSKIDLIFDSFEYQLLQEQKDFLFELGGKLKQVSDNKLSLDDLREEILQACSELDAQQDHPMWNRVRSI